MMTVVRTDPDAGSKGYTLLMIETDGLEGFRRGSLLKKIGQKAQDTCELFFEDCRVPVSASLGEGQGLYQLMASLAYERTIVAIKSIAAIECAVRATLDAHEGAGGVRQAPVRPPEHALQARRGADRPPRSGASSPTTACSASSTARSTPRRARWRSGG